jgi:hypothetical protein
VGTNRAPGRSRHLSVLTSSTGHCRECKYPLVEIDNRSKRLAGCMTCNIWWSADDKKVGNLAVKGGSHKSVGSHKAR